MIGKSHDWPDFPKDITTFGDRTFGKRATILTTLGLLKYALSGIPQLK